MHDMTRLARPHINPQATTHSAVFLGYYFNLGFAMELYLKAFLRDKTSENVAKYGHDLQALLTTALANGFDFQEHAIADIVKIIGPDHKGLKFRYAEGASTFQNIKKLDLVEIALTACNRGLSHLA